MVDATAGGGGRNNSLSVIGDIAGSGTSSSAPRVYVPVSVPESNVPTYAVLELVGFSTPATTGGRKSPLPSPMPSPLPSPSTRPAPPQQSSSATGGGFYRNYVVSPLPSPVAPKLTLLESTPPASPSGSRIPSAAAAPTPAVSISQTERETIVHTSSDKFKDVVRQLTGASSDDTDLMPVTLPARLANRGVDTSRANPAALAVAPGESSAPASKGDLGLRKAPLKLHERRKALRNLERLSCFRTELGYTSSSSSSSSSSCSSSPLAPSPVTPLASDFERFCNARTPTAAADQAQKSSVSGLSLTLPSSSPRFQDAGFASLAPSPTVMSPHFGHGVSSLPSPQQQQQQQQQQMPAKTKEPPVLLNLFPEAPLRS